MSVHWPLSSSVRPSVRRPSRRRRPSAVRLSVVSVPLSPSPFSVRPSIPSSVPSSSSSSVLRPSVQTTAVAPLSGLLNALKIAIHNTKHTKTHQPYIQTQIQQIRFLFLFESIFIFYISKFHNSYFIYFIYFVYSYTLYIVLDCHGREILAPSAGI